MVFVIGNFNGVNSLDVEDIYREEKKRYVKKTVRGEKAEGKRITKRFTFCLKYIQY